jgi:uncharacterized iron-regulated membrane protein
MIKTSFLRKLHRVLGVVIGIQLLIWTVSGAVFAWNDIESVRGDDKRIRPEPLALGSDWVAPSEIDFDGQLDPGRISGLDLARIGDATFYRFQDDEGRTVLADVVTGKVRTPLDRDEAVALARASFAGDVEVGSATLLTADQVGSHHEYRSGVLPAWVVQLDHPSNTRVYVTQHGAAVTSHRNRTWRIFDFFWMLHTMDYRGRDDFNHALIKTISLAAIALGISGYFLFGRTSAVLRRRR